MGKLKKGINGFVTGRSKNTVYYELNGENIFRTIGENDSNTALQQANRTIGGELTLLFTPLMDYIRIGFKDTPKLTWNFHNLAFSYNYLNAIKGIAPQLEIDFTKVRLTMGSLPAPKNPKVVIIDNTLQFSWDADMENEASNKKDQVMIAVYFPETRQSICLYNGAGRTEGKESIPLNTFKEKMVLETYISFISDDRKTLSNSVYAGQLIWDNN